MRVFFTKKAEKELSHVASSDIQRVLQKIELLDIPFPENMDIKKMGGVEDFYRIRVGKIRIIFEIVQNKKEIWIRKIGYRGNIYK